LKCYIDIYQSLHYNQGKTYREIAEEAKMSPRDIGVIVNRAVDEKELEIEDKENQAQTNLTGRKLQEQDLSVSIEEIKDVCL
jgi:DNA-binding transcriptional regulator LsrR (DeoR family)